MLRDDDAVRTVIEALESLVIRRLAEEDTHGGTRSEFVGGGGIEVRIASTAKDTKMLIRRLRSKHGEVQSGESKSLGRQDVP